MVANEVTKNGPGERLSWKQLLAFGVGNMGDPIVGGNLTQLTNPLYNAVLGIPATLIGVMVFLPRLWDAFADPLCGQWSDNCRSRWGRRRPFLFVGAIGLAVSFFLFWSPPFAVGSSTALAAWLLILGFAVYTFWTVFFIPYGALAYELSLDYDERTRIMGVRMAVAQVAEAIRGYMLPFGLILISKTSFAGSQRRAFAVAGLAYALIIMVSGLITALSVKERFGRSAAVGMSIWQSMGTTLRDRLYLRLVCFQILFTLGLFFLATTIVYLITIYMNDPALFGHQCVANAIMVLVWIFLWNKITPYIGKVWALRIGVLFCIAAAAITYVAYVPGCRWRAFLVSLLWGPGWAAYTVMAPAIIADLTDLDELKTGKRREGSYASVAGFIAKLALTGVGVLVGLVLDYVVKFDASLGACQTPETWQRMRIWTVFIPLVFFGLAMLFLARFPLTRQRMHEIHALLDVRRRNTTGVQRHHSPLKSRDTPESVRE